MKTAHSIDQIIDLEYFLHEDAKQSPGDLHQRDREIGLNLPDHEGEKLTTSELISGWTLSRRDNEFTKRNLNSPGTTFSNSRSLATSLSVIKGLLAGSFTGLAFFAYAGTTPINILVFLTLFVFSQLFIVVLLLSGLLLRKLTPSLKLPSSSFSMLYAIGAKIFVLSHKKWFSHFAREKHDSIRHAFGIVQRNHQLYGSLFYWCLFSLAQLFGIAFNIGLLTSCLVKIITSDLAFGWQSTLQLSSSGIEKLVQFLASPWTWLIPEGVGTPTLLQIKGSHIILKDGIHHLTTTDLVAWWPFLILCLIVYGLLTRILLYISGRLMERHALRQVDFRSPGCRALLRRMRSPVISTQAAPEPEATPSSQRSRIFSEEKENERDKSLQVLLIPDELHESIAASELHETMESKGFLATDQYRFMVGYDQDQQLLDQLAKRQWKSNEGIFIIMESWMVPLVDFLVFLQELRKLSQAETNIEIGLTGKAAETKLTTVRPSEMDIWRKKIESIGDPYIQVLPIRGIRQ